MFIVPKTLSNILSESPAIDIQRTLGDPISTDYSSRMSSYENIYNYKTTSVTINRSVFEERCYCYFVRNLLTGPFWKVDEF